MLYKYTFMLQNSKRTFIEFVNLYILFTTITIIHFSNSKSLVNLYFIAWAGPAYKQYYNIQQ